MKNHKLDLKQISTCRKGLRVERMHTVPHLMPYNNGFHSANGALIAHELCELNDALVSSPSCMRYMLLHDVAEGYVGDTPSNVKVDNPELKTLMDKIEAQWECFNLTNMPDLSVHEKKICKVADLAELGMFCIDELNMGNNNVMFVLNNVVAYLQNYTDIKGCNEFLKYFTARGYVD